MTFGLRHALIGLAVLCVAVIGLGRCGVNSAHFICMNCASLRSAEQSVLGFTFTTRISEHPATAYVTAVHPGPCRHEWLLVQRWRWSS